MQLKIIVLVALFFAIKTYGDPLLVVVLMVKDEASVITQTLQPFVQGGIKDFVIFDTGSTDGTQEIVREFFKQHDGVNVLVAEEPFVDFSTSRNRALDSAERIYPQATFILMPDAEWYMHNVEALLHFCNTHKDDYHASYFITIKNATCAFCVSRLIRCNTAIRFEGVVHEALNQLTSSTLPNTIYFKWGSSQKGRQKSCARWQRDRDLLLKSYTQNPSNPRTLFYLGQTYECLGDLENAYIFYQKRSEIRGWDEEDFITRFRLGIIVQQLTSKDDVSVCPLAISHYLRAFALRPQRAEPLIKIAQYYVERGEMQLAFLFAAHAAKIPYPVHDILFVEKHMYEFARYDILGKCAWYVGEYELGEWAVRQALEVDREATDLKCSLKLYTNRKILMSKYPHISDAALKDICLMSGDLNFSSL